MPRTKDSTNKHKKIKPQKEKKQRGRPKGSIKQKQSQKQTVRVTVNNNGGDGGGGGKRIPGPLPQPPLNIFDPSLITPYYGINNRQPVNPPDPENVDMTELITRLSTQFQKPTQTPVLNNIATPIKIKVSQPVTTEPIKIKPAIVQPIKTEPIKIKPAIVQPIETEPIKIKEPKIKIKPSLVEGEYLGDISNIHSKHADNKQIRDIAIQILKNEKKTRLPKKIKTTEDLGVKIPFARIGEIAGSVASGALTGGLTLAGQALVTGGLSTITAEAIAGSIIGGGVGAGVNNALGGGQIAQVLSGIAGSAATTGAISKYRQRQARQQQAVNETTPLLNGQRLGRGDEHFVPLKLKQLNKVDNDLIRRQQEKFERNLSQIEEDVDGTFRREPQRQPQKTILDKVKKISARKVKEATTQLQQLGSTISEGASNIRQRLTGRNNSGGNYSQIQNVDEDITLGQQTRANPSMSREYWGNSDDRNAQLRNKLWHNDIDKIVENSSASTLQRAMRVKNAKKEMVERKKRSETFKALQDSIPFSNLGHDDLIRDDIAATISNKALEDALKEVNAEGNAASKIQSAIRNKTAKREMENAKIAKVTNNAASRIKAASIRKIKNERVKKEITPTMVEPNSDTVLNELSQNLKSKLNTRAANKLQAATRGLITRQKLPGRIEEQLMNKRLYDIGPRVLERADASFTLQAALRRTAAQGKIKEIKVAKDKIGAAVKRLLTERAETNFNPDNNKAFIKNKSTIGQRLAYSDKQKRLVSKQRRDAAIVGYKNK